MTTSSIFPPRPGHTLGDVTTRSGTVRDLALATAMHRRCSADSIYRRFHTPMPVVGARIVRQLLNPAGGWSQVATRTGELIALSCAAPLSPAELEVGLLVEDAAQAQGLGARMLRELAADAATRGYQQLSCLTQSDNARVVATVRNAGLTARLTSYDGFVQVSVPLTRLP
jgi:GNAT superfamily N-acetyltransferase